MGQVAPLGATSSKGVRGGGSWGHNLNLLVDFSTLLELQMGRGGKKKVIGVFYGSLETYIRYHWVADEEQKNVLSVFYGSLWLILLKWAMGFFNFFKGGHLKKSLGNAALDILMLELSRVIFFTILNYVRLFIKRRLRKSAWKTLL